MLSEREIMALRQIERSMREDAPDLAGALTRMEPHQAWSRRRHDAVVVLSALSALLCIVVGVPGSALVALMLCAAVVGVRRWRFPQQRFLPQPDRLIRRWKRAGSTE